MHHFTKLAILAFASLVAANPVPGEASTDAVEALAANCNGSIGNCYDNGCDGNPTTLVCLAVSLVSFPPPRQKTVSPGHQE